MINITNGERQPRLWCHAQEQSFLKQCREERLVQDKWHRWQKTLGSHTTACQTGCFKSEAFQKAMPKGKKIKKIRF